MTELVVSLPKPHEAQIILLNEAKRFNVACLGRRSGKTTIGVRLVKPAITDAHKIGYFSPTYKDTAEVWRELKSRLFPIIKRKDEQLKQIELLTGGIIDFWSLDDPDSGRGRKYHRAIIDEAEKVKQLKYAWENTIRPTLTDYRGDAWIMSTPKGINRYFYELFNNKDKYDNWMSWTMPTSCNPYISIDEIHEAELQLDPITFKQEYLAQFVSMADKPWMYCFEDRHIKEVELNKKDTVYLSFDFNVDPITCIAANVGRDYIYITHEFRLRNSDTYELCDHISSVLGDCHFIVTGDASGRNRSTTSKGNLNNYTIIKNKLRLAISQIKVPKSNLSLSESRPLCNSVMSRLPYFLIHPRCKYLIEDNRFTQAKDGDQIDKNKDAHKAHLFDGERYLIHLTKPDFIRRN